MGFILRGRRSICWGWRLTLLALLSLSNLVNVILSLFQRVAERVAMDRSAAQAMVVAPTAGKMDSNKQLVGRVMKSERTDLVFSCYLLCGTSRKELIYLEAWRELATVAQAALQDGALVSLLNATLVAQKAEKVKSSLSPSQRAQKSLIKKVLN